MISVILIAILALGGTTASHLTLPSYQPQSSSLYGSAFEDQNAAITSFTRNIRPSSSDTTSFTTSNGISSSHNVQVIRFRPTFYKDEYGQSDQSGTTTLAMNGHSYHQSPEGMHVSLTWTADENGFFPHGNHLPKTVQLPENHAEAHRQAHLLAVQSDGYGSSVPSSSSSMSFKSPPMSYPSYSAPPHPSAYQLVAPVALSQEFSNHGYY